MKLKEYRAAYSAFVDEVKGYDQRKAALLIRIEAATDRNKRRGLVRSFLSDPKLKLHYLLKSVQRKDQLGSYPPDVLRAAAQELTAMHYISEPVTPVNLPAGPQQRRRTTYNFGPRRHAMQSMAADVIKAIFPIPSGRHFTINGGVRAALTAVEGHARQGFMHTVERDISQFYPSVNLIGLAKLLQPLPGSVVMNVLAFRPGYSPSEASRLSTADDDAPLTLRGLLAQGSAASPVAAEVIVADLLKDMPPDVRIVSYADNVLILGRTLDSANAASAFLEVRANEHACGPLRLKASPKISDISEARGIDFLGNQGYWRNGSSGGEIKWEPGYFALENIMRKIEEAGTAQQILKTIERLRRWRRGYPLWENGETETARYVAQLGARLAFSSPSLSNNYIIGVNYAVSYCCLMRALSGHFPDLEELMPDFDQDAPGSTKRLEFIASVRRRTRLSESS